MKKCAVIIGVNQTGRLPVLDAAVRNAERFNEWALSQEYKTTPLTDADGPVSVGQIKKAVNDFVEKRSYDLMIIYFSGHGILQGAEDEYWLLSGAPGDANEAVLVAPSAAFARRSGIPHVVFISDACRSVPKDPLISGMLGSVIFPNTEAPDTDPTLDIFYATKPGNAAYEVAAEDAVAGYRSIFTDCLLEALGGGVPELLEELTESGRDYRVVLSQELKRYLREAVPLAARSANITLQQLPESRVESVKPRYLSRFVDEDRLWLEATAKLGTERRLTPQLDFLNESPVNPLAQFMQVQANFQKSSDFSTGLTIAGLADAPTLAGLDLDAEIFSEKDAWQVRFNGDSLPKRVLLILPGGNAVPIAILPDFIGVLVMQGNQVLNVNYTPSPSSARYNAAQENDMAMQQRRARIALSAREGEAWFTGDGDYLINTASYLREYKRFDPTLGLYAAYAYAGAGDFRGVRSIFRYMKREPEPVLFDIALLSQFLRPDFNPRILRNAWPMCPLLNKGWSYLAGNPDRYPEDLRELSKHRIPGLWTTFKPAGIDRFFELQSFML
ncbi:MAG: caspase family protein [Bacteroidota bacterium]